MEKFSTRILIKITATLRLLFHSKPQTYISENRLTTTLSIRAREGGRPNVTFQINSLNFQVYKPAMGTIIKLLPESISLWIN
jgi:hypothetical protein